MQPIALLFGLVLALAICACSRHDTPPEKRIAPQAELMGTVGRGVYTSPPVGGVAQKLYADDIASDTIALSIAIETLGDVSTVIIPRGTKLPTAHTEVFSTAQDDQDRVQVHVLQGERPLVSQNRSLGKFQLSGIPPAPRGVPQIEVTFAIDQLGVLTVTARDKATGQSRQIWIDGSLSGALDKATVDKILAETAAAKPQDDLLREWAEVKLELDTLIYGSKRLVKDIAPKLSKRVRGQLERELGQAESILALSTKPGDPTLLRAVKESLQKAVHAASEELYGRKAP